MRVGETLLFFGEFDERLRGFFVGELAVPFLKAAPLLAVVPLPLARRVIHHRCEAQHRMRAQRVEHFDYIGGRDLAAQMQKMIGAQQLALRKARERFRATRLDAALARTVVRARADRERIEHGGDAGGGNLRVVDHERGIGIPVHAGARREVLLEIVGVQLDQTGQQIVAVPVLGFARGCRAACNVANHAVFDPHNAGEFFIPRNDAGVPDQHRNAPYWYGCQCSAAV